MKGIDQSQITDVLPYINSNVGGYLLPRLTNPILERNSIFINISTDISAGALDKTGLARHLVIK